RAAPHAQYSTRACLLTLSPLRGSANLTNLTQGLTLIAAPQLVEKSTQSSLTRRDLLSLPQNGGGTKAGLNPSAAGKTAAVGRTPVRTQRSIAPIAVRICGPVKLQ